MWCLLCLCWWWLETLFCIFINMILIIREELLVWRIIIHTTTIIIYLILFRCEILSHLISHWAINWMRWWCSGSRLIILCFVIGNSLRRTSISIVIVIVRWKIGRRIIIWFLIILFLPWSLFIILMIMMLLMMITWWRIIIVIINCKLWVASSKFRVYFLSQIIRLLEYRHLWSEILD